MMTADELRTLCTGIRARSAEGGPPPDSPEVDAGLVGLIEADVEEYRARFLVDPVPEEPPEPLRKLLPLMGWLIFEVSLDRLWEVKTRFETLRGAEGEASRVAASLIRRLSDAGRALVWPQFAPRLLGAIRAQALVESKRDTEAGYDAAYILHQEARERHRSYDGSLRDGPLRDRLALDLDEVLLTLALAETGTACRTAERVIGRWDQDFRAEDPDQDRDESERWTQRMFAQLVEGIEIGTRALADGRRIKATLGLVDGVTETRLTLVTGLRNPAIMTCRAILLAYSMCPQMELLGRIPPAPAETWPEYQRHLLDRFDATFPTLLLPVSKPNGEPWPLSADHSRSLVQLCLHLGLVTPRHPLHDPVRVDDELTLTVLDDDAVERMCAWLATEVDGKQRGDANTIGTASKPDFISSVEACRRDTGAASDYRRWRSRWFELDRYAGEDGRRTRIDEILGIDRDGKG
ncbi:hypothetical protein [Micromonospora sp. NBC_01796]|uniref:hypothetical protein n=1 Tax=Micromonospora sp. NBC_01796 TaxID=2975987 RepID=UPI002DD9BFCE|nr:hypothetical protein [Micromonospora sp. NBC_01796]WSA84154.1 hypothetical protein OIE47_27885 [Micromonospora sp. NBC_01796]